MSNGLEEIKSLRGFNKIELNDDKNINKSLDIIENELLELKSIKEANPSEALESLEKIGSYDEWSEFNNTVSDDFPKEYNAVKNYILKAQELKVKTMLCLKKTMIYMSN